MPLAFKFRYEQYLKLKNKIEQDKALDFAAAMSRLQQAENGLSELENRKVVHLMMGSAFTGNTLFAMQMATSYLMQLNEDIKHQQVEITDRRQEVDKRRHILNEAMKERKIIEKLKEKQLEAYTEDIRKKETINEGETALQMVRRRS